MRKFMAALLFVCIAVGANAQNENKTSAYKKRPTFALNVVLNDFKTAEQIRSFSLSSVLNNNKWAKVSEMGMGVGLQYLKGLSNHFDFSTRLDVSVSDYKYRNDNQMLKDKFLVEWDASVRGKFLDDRYLITPYVSAGVGASMFQNRFGAFVPLGGGLQFSLGQGDAFIFTDVQYRVPVTNWVNYHLNYSIGVGGALTEKKTAVVAPPPPPPVVEKDTDGDGIVDSKDKCPTVPGVAKYDGCPIPDTDGDGINDEEDKCPTVPGIAKYQGCPIPDTDGDGINDEEDKCPTVKGLAKYHGCPIPDTDGDGVNDEEDRCPTEAGPASNFGCPTKAQKHQAKVDTAATKIFFATGSATLLKKSYTSLNEVAKLLKDNADLMIEVSGHTDNTGTDKINNRLSQSRADAVAKYLKSKGAKAAQISSKGYGSTQPIADNSTAEGKAKNRRVELKLVDK